MTDSLASSAGGGAPPLPVPDAALAPLSWSWNPWHEHPARALLASLSCGAVFVILSRTLGLPMVALALTLAVAGMLSPLLVPYRCRVDTDGVQVRGAFGWERRPWSQVRRAAASRGGIVVFTSQRPERRDAFRALLLPLPSTSRATLGVAVQAHLQHHGL